jgi:N-acetylglucosamine-6-phosphate deacetylase
MNLAASGDPNASGDFELGADIFINEKGELSGSRLTMNLAYRNMILHTGVSMPEASRMASLNPARILGIDRETGLP